jgi:NOL1/NOP2/fmu family ribosome biogenesis protein
MSAGSFLVSNELVRNRAAVLEENVSRWGNPNVAITCNHPRDFAQLHNAFDLIVVDAPCSGEGMFRKDPKVIQHWSPKAMHDCADRQREILESVKGALKPGGRLVYSTCTYNPFENEDIVQWMLDSGEFELVKLEFPDEWGLTPGTTKGYSPAMKHSYHCYPHKVKGEGFFFACLQKTKSSKSQAGDAKPKGGKPRHKQHAARPTLEPATRKQAQELSKWIKNAQDFDFFLLGETAFALSSEWEETIREIVAPFYLLKAGIKLGEFKRDTLVPDHDLAMSELQAEDIPLSDLEEEQALRFLKRTELHQDHPGWTGWGIVRFQGRNLGWIKSLPGRINNHFPKEMRIRSDLGLD